MTKDKKVVLFGRTGDGKSTIANVLVTGGIENVVFKFSDSARGCTSNILKESGRGWVVTDTVGLGEAEVGAINHTEARNILIEFLKSVKDQYSHIIYVQKAKRITTIDEMIWNLFVSIFEGAEEAFVVVITGASQEWLAENRSKFPDYWTGQTILATDIPPVSKRPIIEKRLRAVREKSIEKLESDLDALFKRRGSKYSTPEIAKMDDAELAEKSRSILAFIISQIKKLFEKSAWQAVARKISSLINVGGFILDVVLLANAV